MAKSMSGQSNLFNPETSEGSSSAISSPASGDGVTPSDSPAGQMTEPSGLGAVPVSRSRVRAPKLAGTMRAIFGQRGHGSSASAALTLSLVSRLKARLDTAGSTVFVMTWREKTTPSGRSVCRLVASARHTPGRAFGSLPTPVARDYRNGLHSKAALERRKLNSRGVNLNEYMERMLGRGGTLNPRFVCLLMGYPVLVDACAVTAMPSSRKSRKSSSKRISMPNGALHD